MLQVYYQIQSDVIHKSETYVLIEKLIDICSVYKEQQQLLIKYVEAV